MTRKVAWDVRNYHHRMLEKHGASLRPKERQAFELRWGIGTEPHVYREIAEVMGFTTTERPRQLCLMALFRLGEHKKYVTASGCFVRTTEGWKSLAVPGWTSERITLKARIRWSHFPTALAALRSVLRDI